MVSSSTEAESESESESGTEAQVECAEYAAVEAFLFGSVGFFGLIFPSCLPTLRFLLQFLLLFDGVCVHVVVDVVLHVFVVVGKVVRKTLQTRQNSNKWSAQCYQFENAGNRGNKACKGVLISIRTVFRSFRIYVI